jgi:hypothetical protein
MSLCWYWSPVKIANPNRFAVKWSDRLSLSKLQRRDRQLFVAASSYTVGRRTLLACVEKNSLLDRLENS